MTAILLNMNPYNCQEVRMQINKGSEQDFLFDGIDYEF